jgi:hypothetical protein
VEANSAAQGGRTEGGDMLRRHQLIAITTLSLACSLPASAAVAQQDLRMPDNRDAPSPSSTASPEGKGYQDLRMPDNRAPAPGADVTGTPAGPAQDLRSPDARDAARDLPRVVVSPPVVEVREAPSGGFDWGDAGIGAAGMLALFSIAGGSTLLVTNRRRRRGFQAATH